MNFRLATILDLEEMKQVYVDTIQTVCKNDYTPEEIAMWSSSVNKTQRWLDVIQTQYVLLAEIEGQIVGYGTLKDSDYIDFFYVHKNFQRRGIADKLLSRLELQAKKHLVSKISSDISITAKPFFEKKGYQVIRRQENQRGEIVLINYKMEKIL
jgi:putative acetyltransferase